MYKARSHAKLNILQLTSWIIDEFIVQQCSNKESCSSHIFAYVKERYTNVILNDIEWHLYFALFMQPY